MKDDKKEVTPIIVNGELNIRKKSKNNSHQKDRLPKKSFGFSDIILSLIGLILVIYGIYTLINKEENNVESENVQSNIVEDTKKEEFKIEEIEKYLIFSAEELSNAYSATDINGMINGLPVNDLSNNAKLSLAFKITTPHVVGGETYFLEDELDTSIKTLFGNNITYQKDGFTLGNNIYTYNQETKRYYLIDNTKIINLNYKKFDYTEKEELDNKLIVREYVAYTDLNSTKSWTLNNTLLSVIIDDNNIKEKYKELKCFEYEFIKGDNNYQLDKITIK